jgi:hypothetical protein
MDGIPDAAFGEGGNDYAAGYATRNSTEKGFGSCCSIS